MSRVDFETLFRVKRNEILMLATRGYDVSNQAGLLSFSLEQFAEFYSAKEKDYGSVYRALSFTYSRPQSNDYIYIFYPTPNDRQTGKSTVAELISYLQANPTVQNAIVISETDLSTEARNEIVLYPIYFIQHFLYRELLWNKTAHIFVPVHRLMSDEETETYFRVNPQVGKNQMPLIRESDPQAKYLGGRDGQVIEIRSRTIFYPALVTEKVSYRVVRSDRSIMGS